MTNFIDYNKILNKYLINVFIDALKIVEKEGIVGDTALYITFKTNHPQTIVSDVLKSQYPEKMTIVLQHYFRNLKVEEDRFVVELSFASVPYYLSIPFTAVVGFEDRGANFGLVFPENVSESEFNEVSKNDLGLLKEKQKKTAEVISFSNFKKKK